MQAEKREPGSLLTSVIVACELRYGAARRGSPALVDRVDSALQRITIAPFGDEVIVHYALLRTTLSAGACRLARTTC